MKRKASAAAAVLMALSLMTGCSNKSTSQSGGSSDYTDAVINMKEMEADFKNINDLEGEGAKIYLSNTKAKPGETATVTLSVDNADMQWNMCGIHIIYPDILHPEMVNKEERTVQFKQGDALMASTGSVCMEWQEGLPDILKENKKGCLFFTTMFSGNRGGDGEIATFSFKVPDDAQAGAVYNFGYYYSPTDLFTNEQNIPQYKKYAFTHMQGGSITVE